MPNQMNVSGNSSGPAAALASENALHLLVSSNRVLLSRRRSDAANARQAAVRSVHDTCKWKEREGDRCYIACM